MQRASPLHPASPRFNPSFWRGVRNHIIPKKTQLSYRAPPPFLCGMKWSSPTISPHPHPRRQPKFPAGGKKYEKTYFGWNSIAFMKNKNQNWVMDGVHIRPYLPPPHPHPQRQSKFPAGGIKKTNKTHIGWFPYFFITKTKQRKTLINHWGDPTWD